MSEGETTLGAVIAEYPATGPAVMLWERGRGKGRERGGRQRRVLIKRGRKEGKREKGKRERERDERNRKKEVCVQRHFTQFTHTFLLNAENLS